jgi:hypothetical protein
MSTPSPTPRPRHPRRRLLALLAAGAAAVPAVLATAPAGAHAAGLPLVPPAGGGLGVGSATFCRLTNFTDATVQTVPVVPTDPYAPAPVAGTHRRLTVTGYVPGNTSVRLVPLVYIRQPEHWGIEVTACGADPLVVSTASAGLDPIMPPFVRRYRATYDFTGSLGSCGIEVIGASTRRTFDLAGPLACAKAL